MYKNATQAGDHFGGLAASQAILLDRSGPALPFVSVSLATMSPLDAVLLAQACREAASRYDVFSASFGQGTQGLVFGGPIRVQVSSQSLAESIEGNVSPPAILRSAESTGNGDPLLLVCLETHEKGIVRMDVAACALICDRTSLLVYLRHTLLRYDELASGPNTVSQAEALPYGDFLDWRSALSRESDWAMGLQYWRAYQQEAAQHASAPQLPFLRRGAAVQDRHQRSQPGPVAHKARVKAIDPQVTAAIRHLATSSEVSEDAFFHAAWYVLLARLSDNYRVVYAWLHDCRQDYDALQDAIGPFERIMPLGMDATPDEPCMSLAKKIDAVLQSHRAWQEQIGARLAEGVIEYGLCFSVLRLPEAGEPFAALCAGLGPFGSSAQPLGLLASVVVGGNGDAKLELLYMHERYSTVWMDVIASQYARLLAAIAQQPSRAIGDVRLEDTANLESRSLIGQAVEIHQRRIDEWISHWRQHTPDSIALRYRDVALTYAEIDGQIDRVAARLAGMGLGVGDLVALSMPRSPALVIALMGVLRSGAGYVPLDKNWPAERIAQILEQSQANLLLTDSPLFQELSDGAPCSCLDLAALLEKDGQSAAARTALARDAAYVIFTSGSTGTPKGVVIEHEQIMNYVFAADAGLALSQCQVYGWTSTVAADLGNTALFSAFYKGRTLAIADADESASSEAFRRFLLEKKVDCLKIVPSHLDALLPENAGIPLGTVILGGEPIPDGLPGKLWSIDRNARIYNHYGPTEATIGVLFHGFKENAYEQTEWTSASLLSQAMSNCEVFLVNSRGARAAVGEIGELYIGGKQLARGYLGDERSGGFVEFPEGSGKRCYRTGDLGRYLPQGGLVLCGRLDTQIKIRGYRVEPEEIETVLRGMPGVSQAVALAENASDAPARLVAFVVASADAKGYITNKFLKAELSRYLPDYMVPAVVECVDAFPRLPNGKIDRQQLVRQIARPAAMGGHPPEPDDPLGRLLLNVAGKVLECNGLALDDGFFECGGDSIAAIRYVAELGTLLHIEIMPASIFTHRTFRELLGFLRDALVDGQDGGLNQRAAAVLAEREYEDKPV